MTFKSGDLLGFNCNGRKSKVNIIDICRLYISTLVCVQIYTGKNPYHLVLTNHDSDNRDVVCWVKIA